MCKCHCWFSLPSIKLKVCSFSPLFIQQSFTASHQINGSYVVCWFHYSLLIFTSIQYIVCCFFSPHYSHNKVSLRYIKWYVVCWFFSTSCIDTIPVFINRWHTVCQSGISLCSFGFSTLFSFTAFHHTVCSLLISPD